LSIVEADSTTIDGSTGLSFECSRGLVDGREGNVAKALWISIILVSRKMAASDGAELFKVSSDVLGRGIKRQVADKQSIGSLALDISESIGTIVGVLLAAIAVLCWLSGTRSGEVNVQGLTTELESVHLCESGAGFIESGEVNITETVHVSKSC
jgi:hypothetical protein